MSPAVIPPPVAAGTSWIRLFPVSAMNTSPAESTATASGSFSSALVAAPPSPEDPAVPAELPAMV